MLFAHSLIVYITNIILASSFKRVFFANINKYMRYLKKTMKFTPISVN